MAGDVLLRLGIALLTIVVPVGAVFSRRLLFVLVPVAAALVVVGGLLLPGGGSLLLSHLRLSVWRPIVALGVVVMIWAGLSFLWTPLPDLAIERFAKTVGTVLIAAFAIAAMPARMKPSNGYLLPMGIAAAALATLLGAIARPDAMRALDADGSLLQRSIAGLLVMGWPALAALALRQRLPLAGLVGGLIALACLLASLPTPLIALGLSVGVFLAARAAPQTTARAMGTVAAILMLGAPAIVIGLDSLFSAYQTGAMAVLHSWAEVLRSEGIKLITGHGFDTAVRATAVGLLPSNSPRGLLFEVWYDLGLIGAAGCALIMWLSAVAAGRSPSVLAPYLLASLCAVLTLSISGLSIAQLWWTTQLACAALLVAIVLRVPARGRVQAATVKQRPSL